MKRLNLVLALTGFLWGVPVFAQLELPQASPTARVMQRAGLTDIEVEYSSPAARDRTVWGELVPYGQHWRTGANTNTLIRFSRSVTIDGKEVDAAIDRAMAGLWREPAQAARYLVEQGRDLGRARELADRSIEIERNWYNLWVKAQILHARGNDEKALALTREALDKEDDSGAFRFYSSQMKEALDTWAQTAP